MMPGDVFVSDEAIHSLDAVSSTPHGENFWNEDFSAKSPVLTWHFRNASDILNEYLWESFWFVERSACLFSPTINAHLFFVR